MANLQLADLKQHLNVTIGDDDTLLQGKIDAAEAWITAYVGGPFDTWPAPAVEATRQLAGHLYENREASLVGVQAQELPFGMLEMLAPYRAWTF